MQQASVRNLLDRGFTNLRHAEYFRRNSGVRWFRATRVAGIGRSCPRATKTVTTGTALSTVLLIAPSSYHRLRWRQHDKERMLVISNALTIAGLFLLAVAITATVFVITDFLFHHSWAAVFTAIVAASFLVLWYGLPLAAAIQDRPKPRHSR
jgi:VIT1/CCC1 family predicted Fe2+/Mn2+ transporter